MTTAETHTFQAETQQLLDLMIHSLYTHKEIFLRELISNSSDALDKRRVEGLTDEGIRSDDDGRILLEVDTDARTLVIDDNGIGMTRDEVIENIGTIARSGTRAFLEQFQESRRGESGSAPELIGQFGVGFYSCFMVADRVVLETKRAGSDEQSVRWESTGDGSYTLEESDRAEVGTRITLHLRALPEEPNDDDKDFTKEWVLRETVKRYSDFVEYPIQLEVERDVPAENEDAEPTKELRLETLNSMKPLWTRPREEITDAEHNEFYKHVARDWNDPLCTIHFRAEGTHEYTALLYVPAKKPFDILDPGQTPSRVSLYVRRVFVMERCEELIPPWLRFVSGLVDSSDLPLNVSRETLQHNRRMEQMRKRVVRKVLDALGSKLEKDRAAYQAFWDDLGFILKEGIYLDEAHREDVAKISLWQTSAQDEPTTLGEYTDRMVPGQAAIYYISGRSRRAAESAPQLEQLKARGIEVLYFTERIDEWAVQRLESFGDHKLISAEASDLELPDEDGDAGSERDKEREARGEELADLFTGVQKALDEHVAKVRLSGRLATSPAMLVADEDGPSQSTVRIMREMGEAAQEPKRVLELNPDHAVLTRLVALYGDGDPSKEFEEYCEILYGQALLAEGSPLPDPTRYATLISEMLVRES